MADKLAPRPAATLLLLRDGSLGPEAFMLQRTQSAAFLAGAHVFPGGAVDKADRDLRVLRRVAGITDADASRRLGQDAGGLAYWVAAIRECFEETGILIAGGEDGLPLEGARAVELGAHEAFVSGARLPEKVDVVMETVGAATWAHSLRSLMPGGRVVIAGATSGSQPPADLSRVFFLQLSVVGSTMGTRDELERLVAMCEATGVRPLIDHVLPLSAADEALRHVASGDLFGKIVLTP